MGNNNERFDIIIINYNPNTVIRRNNNNPNLNLALFSATEGPAEMMPETWTWGSRALVGR